MCWDDTSGVARKYFLKGSATMAKVRDHAIKDCYPFKVKVSKADYVEPAPPVEEVDVGTGKADAGKGDLAAGKTAGGTTAGAGGGSTATTGGGTNGGAAIGVKDPSKGIDVKPNDGGDAYTGGTSSGLSLKDPSADPAISGNAPSAARSHWAGPAD